MMTNLLLRYKRHLPGFEPAPWIQIVQLLRYQPCYELAPCLIPNLQALTCQFHAWKGFRGHCHMTQVLAVWHTQKPAAKSWGAPMSESMASGMYTQRSMTPTCRAGIHIRQSHNLIPQPHNTIPQKSAPCLPRLKNCITYSAQPQKKSGRTWWYRDTVGSVVIPESVFFFIFLWKCSYSYR